jgi:hypothetical protein
MNPCTGSCGQLGRVFGSFTATPTEEERNPPPFRLTMVRQVSNARACVADNLPSVGTTIGLSGAAAVTLITLAAMLLHKSAPSGTGVVEAAVMALVMAVLCIAACLHATVVQCLPDSPPADAPGGGA